ncbi:myelin-associated glycoprotein isoform X1 [Dicentrarchus labrax]|uniref:Ig-like domain-containing protein n=1 Tax=Dicentrarchus labrax TaxID=13489 RepID=A0A8P4GG10_DICLA|nr:myelin-associated glycoprotein isoform X1 [Dicentrarchus labrax]XP_051273008.1 myelin-associated glycoprotein isoform X1 [Dicentrarchus labrax]
MMVFCLLVAALSSPVVTEEWKADVVNFLDALVSSCVVVPCSFTHPRGPLPTSRLRGIWHRSTNHKEYIYNEDNTLIVDSFRGRTKLLGALGQNNCTLEIIDIKDHDNGPFCFRIELAKTSTDTSTTDKFSFVEQCVQFKMLTDPPKPILNHAKTAIQNHPYTVTCSVTHTCPSHMPKLTWNKGTADMATEIHREVQRGLWEVQSILTFIPEEKDDHTDVTCTAAFHEKPESSETMTLYVKRAENYNHIIIPTVVGIGTAVLFGVFCILMVKKYKTRIAELQRRDGSVLNRLSRMSRRIRSDGPGPSHTDQRRSIWSRFSRRPKGEMLDLDHMPNNVKSKSCADGKISKPRFPSPKSQPKSCNYNEDLDDGDDYMNTVELNIYGNI